MTICTTYISVKQSDGVKSSSIWKTKNKTPFSTSEVIRRVQPAYQVCMIEFNTYHIQTDGNEDACNHVLNCLNSNSRHSFLIVRVEKCARGRGPEGKKHYFQLITWWQPTLHSIITSVNYKSLTPVVMTW